MKNDNSAAPDLVVPRSSVPAPR